MSAKGRKEDSAAPAHCNLFCAQRLAGIAITSGHGQAAHIRAWWQQYCLGVRVYHLFVSAPYSSSVEGAHTLPSPHTAMQWKCASWRQNPGPTLHVCPRTAIHMLVYPAVQSSISHACCAKPFHHDTHACCNATLPCSLGLAARTDLVRQEQGVRV
jgi:hypothetical protein